MKTNIKMDESRKMDYVAYIKTHFFSSEVYVLLYYVKKIITIIKNCEKTNFVLCVLYVK